VVFAEAARALLGPTITVLGRLAGAVEQPSDLPIPHHAAATRVKLTTI
jgi:hypothetical protein